jgi:hypothetical protein
MSRSMNRDRVPAPPPAPGAGAEGTDAARTPPDRPRLSNPNAAPVMVKIPPPASVRLAQLTWVLSFVFGGFCVVYFFIIRTEQLPLIEDAVRAVDPTRSDGVYARAADIVFWACFAIMVGLLLAQITLLVSFMSRRPGIRWWQLATFIAQVLLYLVVIQLVAMGPQGTLLRPALLLQCGLVLLALLLSTFSRAIAWTARGHDIRRAGQDATAPEV